jgi:DNA-binding transcriptional LysR family regulator
LQCEPDVTLEQLRIFVAVAEREHLTRAAADLNLTPSAVSAAIAALEARHATQLFDRIGRRIALTHAGRLFLGEARAVLARAASAETMLAEFAGLKRGSLALAASQTVSNYWLPPLLAQYRAAYPGIALGLTIGNTETVAGMVHEGSVDVGFVEGNIDSPDLIATPVAEDRLVLVASPALAKAHTPLRRKDLLALPWIFRERGSGSRALFEAALEKRAIALSDLKVILELPSNEAVRRAVEAGAGAAALSRLAVGAALAAGTLVELGFDLPARQFTALRHKDRTSTNAQRALIEMIENKPATVRERRPRSRR